MKCRTVLKKLPRVWQNAYLDPVPKILFVLAYLEHNFSEIHDATLNNKTAMKFFTENFVEILKFFSKIFNLIEKNFTGVAQGHKVILKLLIKTSNKVFNLFLSKFSDEKKNCLFITEQIWLAVNLKIIIVYVKQHNKKFEITIFPSNSHSN